MVVWDSAVHQISTLLPAMSLAPMVLVEKITFAVTRTGCLACGPPWFEGARQRVSGFLGLRAPDRQCLGFKCGKHQTEDYWISSQFLSCLCSSLLLQAANRLHPTWVLVEEHKRAKSANPLNMTVRQPSVLNSVTFCCCSLQIVSVSGLGGSVYTKPPLQQVI